MTKEGARIEILLNATARRNPEGKVIGVVGECFVVDSIDLFFYSTRSQYFSRGGDVQRYWAGTSGFLHLDSLITHRMMTTILCRTSLDD